jgi:Spy/CpxP family protein refolding chaperone
MAAKYFSAGLVAAIFAVAAVAANGVFAHGDDIEYRDPGYGMEYGTERESTDEYCPGCGMIGGHGMGNGMMGGHGMGNGMVRGYGMGFGMMGGPMYGLDMSREQRKQIARIQSELRKHNWALQGEIIDRQDELFEQYADEIPDPKKIGAVYGKIFDLRRQMIEATIDAHNRQRAILTDEQREQLQKSPHGPKNGGYRSGPRGMRHHHDHHMMGGLKRGPAGRIPCLSVF